MDLLLSAIELLENDPRADQAKAPVVKVEAMSTVTCIAQDIATPTYRKDTMNHNFPIAAVKSKKPRRARLSPLSSPSPPKVSQRSQSASKGENRAPILGQCEICDGMSSGYHYKVMACEGCKGFFRRSIRKGAVYKCYRNDDCNINVLTRNQCQACRLKKCLQMGMSKEAIQPERNKQIPKRQQDASKPLMEETERLLEELLLAHHATFTPTNILVNELASPSHISCTTTSALWDDDSDLSTTGIFRAIQFARRVAGFASLCREDQAVLLRHACIEIMVLRFCTRFIPEKDGYYLPNGKSLSTRAIENHFGELAVPMVELSETLIKLNIDVTELALMQSIILLSSARPGLKFRQQVQHLEEKVSTALMMHVYNRRITCMSALQEIVDKLFSLRRIGRIGSSIILTPQRIQKIEEMLAQITNEL